MKKTFALGAVAGITSMALAVPMLAQISSAQTSSAASSATSMDEKNVFFHPMNVTQEDVQTLIDRDNAFLTNADAMLTILKTATQDHRNALQSAEAITDDTERQNAVKAADDAFRTSIHEAITANPALQGVMMPFGRMGHGGHRMGGMHDPEDLAAKLGMTQAELKAAFESGKTLEQIAEEKGITLPARPQWHHQMEDDNAATNQSSSSIQ